MMLHIKTTATQGTLLLPENKRRFVLSGLFVCLIVLLIVSQEQFAGLSPIGPQMQDEGSKCSQFKKPFVNLNAHITFI